MGVGEGACVGGNAGTEGTLGSPARSPPSETHPARTTRALHTLAEGCVFREDFLDYLYSYFIYNPNSKTEKINYTVDKFMQDRERPNHAPAHL